MFEVIKISPKYILELFKLDYETWIWEKWGESIFWNIIEWHEFAFPSDENITSIHKDILNLRKESDYTENVELLPV